MFLTRCTAVVQWYDSSFPCITRKSLRFGFDSRLPYYPFLIAEPIIIPTTITAEDNTTQFASGEYPIKPVLNLTIIKVAIKYMTPITIRSKEAITVTKRLSKMPSFIVK